ncbi:unnamed protein product [Penicillium roqueforti FM164]|uniref:Genomic scaffold, ProqFM164S02 n=1 Tax=Penicillium roqueforti (strain FM164) TaxID=1365484 RepID=W6Q2S8_PENRF|nr:unnamed protein product [Penicillium roqueforti FM164]
MPIAACSLPDGAQWCPRRASQTNPVVLLDPGSTLIHRDAEPGSELGNRLMSTAMSNGLYNIISTPGEYSVNPNPNPNACP